METLLLACSLACTYRANTKMSPSQWSLGPETISSLALDMQALSSTVLRDIFLSYTFFLLQILLLALTDRSSWCACSSSKSSSSSSSFSSSFFLFWSPQTCQKHLARLHTYVRVHTHLTGFMKLLLLFAAEHMFCPLNKFSISRMLRKELIRWGGTQSKRGNL